MSWRKPGSMILAGLLVFSVAALAMSHVTPAFAAVSMGQDNPKIYGSGLGRALITDTALQGSPQDTILVHVDAKRGTTTLGSKDVQVKEIGTSGQFELFVTTANAPFNPASSTFDPSSAVNAYVVRINPTPLGDANDANMTTSQALKDGDSIVLTYGGQQSTFMFQKSIASVSVDRTTAGAGTLVTVSITDNDANVDPTKVDSFNATSSVVSALIGGIDKAAFATGGAKFTETGQNTGVFQHAFQIGGNVSATQSIVNTTSITLPQSATFRIVDHDVYANVTGATAPYNAPISTSNSPSTSVTLSNNDGQLVATAPVTMANGLQIQVTDPDRNLDTSQQDTIPAGQVTVTVAGLTGTVNNVAFKETGPNTGIFVPDITDNRIPIVFGTSSSVGTTSITMNSTTIAANKDITVSYNDAHSSSNNAASFSFVTHLTHSPGTFSGPGTSVGVTGTFGLTLTAPDLNTNPNSVESYTVTFPTGISTATAANLPFGIGSFTASAAGKAWNPSSPFAMTFIETGPNTGIFTASNIKMQSINNGIALNDGDQVEFKFADNKESPVQTSTVDITVGAPGKSIQLSKTTIPLPRAGSSDVSKVVLTITDPSADTQTGSINSIPLAPGSFTMTMSDGTVVGLPTMSGFTGVTLTETGVGTGVFTGTLNVGAGSATNAVMNNAKIKISYNDVSTSMIVRPYDGTMTISSTNVANGQNVTVTVYDQGRNSDPTVRENIDGVTLATKNDAVGSLAINDLQETGADTGIFTKTIVIGKDIKVGDLNTNTFASEIDAKYIDPISSDLSTNVSRDLTMHVQTATGSVDVTPTAVGPGSKVAIVVHDNDLNTNPQGVDRTASGSEYLRIASDRSGVNVFTNATGEETGPNTGMFKTTLTLSPLRSGDTLATAFAGSGKDITGKVLPGDLISIRYTDQKDASGSKMTVAKTFKVMSVDPMINATSATVTAGNSFGVMVSDLDANTDPESVDSINVKVTSDSDPVGMTTTLIETGPDTGVFAGTINTSTGVSAGSITVKTGDNVQVKYTDKFPADYAQRVKQVVDASKDFTFVVPVGIASGGDVTATTPSNPVVKDFSNQNVNEVTTGKQVVLSTTISNNQGTVRPFAAIVEVRNADGITVYLQWQTGTLTPNGNTNVGLSWTPDAPGSYSVRTFVVNDIANPAALSQIASTTINVS